MMLFATIVKQNKDKAWKSLRHEDGELCFGGGWFIVGIDTPEGSYTYHYENKYFDLFDCEELERSKHWDGHTEKDVTRLLSLPKTQLSQEGTTKDTTSVQPKVVIGHWIQYDKRFPWRHHYKCSVCGNYLDFTGVNGGMGEANFCPNCGAKMKGERNGH
jgi:hypothetical protein